MSTSEQRGKRRREELAGPWDVIVIGGGITGAGILREAARAGLRCLLLEQADFASGTSSRSSKLVHGGLRYLSQGHWRLTRDAVRERERLLHDGGGLVEKQGFLLPVYGGQKPGRRALRAGLRLYDLLAGKRRSSGVPLGELGFLAPRLRTDGLVDALHFTDARTDDARLVLRVLQEAERDGARALNYTAVTGLVEDQGRIRGVRIGDRTGGTGVTAQAAVVVNATGAWAPRFMGANEGAEPPRLRALRGSHLLFPYWRLPTSQAVSFFHPQDRRMIFMYPWEGVVLLGTTDIDHAQDMNREPRMSEAECEYLLEGVNHQFPGAALGADDAIASYAGVRSVVDTGAERPSDESRDHALWLQPGLLTVTGGKLTTFRLTAIEALEKARPYLPNLERLSGDQPVLNPVQTARTAAGNDLPEQLMRRIYGRYGAWADSLLAAAGPGELEAVGNTPYLWAELRWAARAEAMVHLRDLLLRRTRIALVAPDGGAHHLPRIGDIAREELGWDDNRWEREREDYLTLWRHHYAPMPWL